eukprot:2480345-Prymnesium_polylepis.1
MLSRANTPRTTSPWPWPHISPDGRPGLQTSPDGRLHSQRVRTAATEPCPPSTTRYRSLRRTMPMNTTGASRAAYATRACPCL